MRPRLLEMQQVELLPLVTKVLQAKGSCGVTSLQHCQSFKSATSSFSKRSNSPFSRQFCCWSTMEQETYYLTPRYCCRHDEKIQVPSSNMKFLSAGERAGAAAPSKSSTGRTSSNIDSLSWTTVVDCQLLNFDTHTHTYTYTNECAHTKRQKKHRDLHTIVPILFSEMWLLSFRIRRFREFREKEFRKISGFCERRFSGERASAAATTAPVKSSTGRTTVDENSSSEKLQMPQSSRKNGTWQRGTCVVWNLIFRG